MPLAAAVGFHLVDTLVHGWDVASRSGATVAYDDELAAAGLEQAERVPTGRPARGPARRSPRRCPATADDDNAFTRTLRLLGRNPAWRPAHL